MRCRFDERVGLAVIAVTIALGVMGLILYPALYIALAAITYSGLGISLARCTPAPASS
jgi:hypothetical protein